MIHYAGYCQIAACGATGPASTWRSDITCPTCLAAYNLQVLFVATSPRPGFRGPAHENLAAAGSDG